jgi:hypothetical protein
MRALAADPALGAAIGQANRARIRRIFCETKMVDSYRALIRRQVGWRAG